MKKYINLSLCVLCTAVACAFFVFLLDGQMSVNNCVFFIIFAIAAIVFSHHYSEPKYGDLKTIS